MSMASDQNSTSEQPPDDSEPRVRALVSSEHRMAVVPHGTAEQLQSVRAWGALMAASGFFKDARSEAQAAVKILYGMELGFSVGASMTDLHVIDGKLVIGANLHAAAVKRSGKYDYRVLELDDEHCAIEFYELVRRPDGVVEREALGPPSVFNLDDAERAALTDRGNRMYEKYPRNMVFSRAMTNGIAWYCPDVFETRVYTPDEIRPDLELGPQGEVIDLDAISVAPPEQRRQQQREQRQQPAAQQQRERARAADQPEDVHDVATFMTWATTLRQRYGLGPNSKAILAAVGVENARQITERFGNDWAQAKAIIRQDLERPRGDVPERDVDEPDDADPHPSASGVDALTDDERVLYEAAVESGRSAEDAYVIARGDDPEEPTTDDQPSPPEGTERDDVEPESAAGDEGGAAE